MRNDESLGTLFVALSGTDQAGPAVIANGSVVWQRQFSQAFSTVRFSGDGRRVLLGERPNDDPAPDQLLVLKRTTGQIRSRTVLPARMSMVAWTTSYYSDSRVDVLGSVDGRSSGGDGDFLTMSIRLNSGIVSWRARFGRYGRADLPATVEVHFDDRGKTSVIVTGASHIHAGDGLDYVTVSYSA